jgi:ATP-dependent Lon protease
MAPMKAFTLPVIPLAKDTVLLPGIVLRIPVAGNRPDIPAVLSNVYSRAASKTPSQRLDNVNIACVPLNSPFLTQNGQKMITDDKRSPKPKERLDISPSATTKEDLFGYGVAAKISGVEGRGTGEFALLVEGVARIRIDKFTQERPFFEAEVTYEYDDGEHKCLHFQSRANTLKLYLRKTWLFKDCSHTLSNSPGSY